MASHRHHSARPPPPDTPRDRERPPPHHIPPPQIPVMTPLQQQQSIPHPNGVHHSAHASPALSNGHPHPHPHPQQLISPTQSVHPVIPPAPPQVNGHSSALQKLAKANEETWLLIGEVAEQMSNLDFALTAYEHALRHNPRCVPALSQVAGIARIKENYPKAIDYFQRVVNLPGHESNGDVWSALGHCYLMQDELQKAYTAYQQALYHLPNPKEDPKLWYGIGILYDRYGSLDHAEEAFSSVLRMEKEFDKTNEILFRLGIIYKQQGKYESSLECFDRILRSPPSPLAHVDIWFQIGHVYEQQKDYVHAKEAYERVVVENPNHAKVLQQLGWLYHQQGAPFQNQELAIQYLTKSLEADPSDAQSWYLLGRAYMAGQKYNKAYEAYQQAVYRDGRNPTFWCSIGVLYFQINQYRDALDAYSRAIRINPYISEVWFDLGSLYESCNNQISDAIDAYGRAAELDPFNPHIKQRLDLLKNVQENGGQLPSAPGPQDVHPTAYASSGGHPGGPGMMHGPPGHAQGGRLLFRSDSRGSNDPGALPAPAPPSASLHHPSPGPFRGGPPPPVILDDARRPSQHTQLAPMEIDRPPHTGREAGFPPTRSGIATPLPQPPVIPPPHVLEFNANRRSSPSISPPHNRPRSPPFPNNGYKRAMAGTSMQTSPRGYPRESGPQSATLEAYERPFIEPRRDNRPKDRERGDRTRERDGRESAHSQPDPGSRYTLEPLKLQEGPSEEPKPSVERSVSDWELRTQLNSGAVAHLPPTPSSELGPDVVSRRYDPIHHERDRVAIRPPHQEGERPLERKIDFSPENFRSSLKTPYHPTNRQATESPHPSAEPRRKARAGKDRERDSEYVDSRRDRRKRGGPSRRQKDDLAEPEPTRITGFPDARAPAGIPKLESPDEGRPAQESGVELSPPDPTARLMGRPVDEDYDEGEGVAETLIGLASQKASEAHGSSNIHHDVHAVSSLNERQRRHSQDDDSKRHSPSLKRPLSPGPVDTGDSKRPRTESGSAGREPSPPLQRQGSPARSSRPSPIPFRVQASPEIFRSAEMDKERSVEPSVKDSRTKTTPSPPPTTQQTIRSPSSDDEHAPLTLPPIATISPRPASTTPSEAAASRKDGMAERKSYPHGDPLSPQASTPVSGSTGSVPPPPNENGGTRLSPAANPSPRPIN